MPHLIALDAPFVQIVTVRCETRWWRSLRRRLPLFAATTWRTAPDLEASVVFVADLPTTYALRDIFLAALGVLVAHLVTLEAHLGVAVKAIVQATA